MAARDTALTATEPASGHLGSASEQQGSVVVARGVRRSFDGRSVLRDLDFDLRAGEFVALVGRSGSGKSTFLRALAGLDGGVEGSLLVPRRRSVVFQEPRLIPWRRVIDNVKVGQRGAAARQAAQQALAEVGLQAHAGAWPRTLSGGEAQRVALARAMMRAPALLLLDEPFGALDALTRIRMHVLLRDLWQRHSPAVVLVTHDVDEAILLADRVLVLTDGSFAQEVVIELPTPRRRSDPAFMALRSALLARLGVEDDAPAPAQPADVPGGSD